MCCSTGFVKAILEGIISESCWGQLWNLGWAQSWNVLEAIMFSRCYTLVSIVYRCTHVFMHTHVRAHTHTHTHTTMITTALSSFAWRCIKALPLLKHPTKPDSLLIIQWGTWHILTYIHMSQCMLSHEPGRALSQLASGKHTVTPW